MGDLEAKRTALNNLLKALDQLINSTDEQLDDSAINNAIRAGKKAMR